MCPFPSHHLPSPLLTYLLPSRACLNLALLLPYHPLPSRDFTFPPLPPQANQSFFGFQVPLQKAVWLELLIIQVASLLLPMPPPCPPPLPPPPPPPPQLVVPNSSFLGHLAGILAGLLYVKVQCIALLADH